MDLKEVIEKLCFLIELEIAPGSSDEILGSEVGILFGETFSALTTELDNWNLVHSNIEEDKPGYITLIMQIKNYFLNNGELSYGNYPEIATAFLKVWIEKNPNEDDLLLISNICSSLQNLECQPGDEPNWAQQADEMLSKYFYPSQAKYLGEDSFEDLSIPERASRFNPCGEVIIAADMFAFEKQFEEEALEAQLGAALARFEFLRVGVEREKQWELEFPKKKEAAAKILGITLGATHGDSLRAANQLAEDSPTMASEIWDAFHLFNEENFKRSVNLNRELQVAEENLIALKLKKN
jgi:hypothetical protein